MYMLKVKGNATETPCYKESQIQNSIPIDTMPMQGTRKYMQIELQVDDTQPQVLSASSA